MDLNNLQKDEQPLKVQWAGGEVNLRYKPLAYDYAMVTQINEGFGGEADKGGRAFCALVSSWDVTANGEPIELTPEALVSHNVPWPLILTLMRETVKDAINSKNAYRFSAGSGRATPSTE